MKQVRWGLVSTANINRWLMPAIRASERGELVAVASREPEQARAYADKWEIPLSFGSYETMLQSGAVDAVYISLPNHLHAPWAIRSLRAGVHVLCEKPFALTMEDVDAMSAAAAESGCVLAEAFMYRHHPQTKLVGDWVRSGRLGDVTAVHATFDFAFSNRNNIRLVPEWGGGCLWDVGVYPVSYAQFILGGPPTHAFGQQWIGDTGVDEVFVGQLRYHGDRFAQIAASFRTPFHTRVEIKGTEGRIVVDRPFVRMEGAEAFWFYPVGREPEAVPVASMSLYLGEVEDMHDAILDGASTYLSLAETRNHVRTVLALYESARTGRVLALEADEG